MKDFSSQQVTEHLKQLNAWWHHGKMDSESSNLTPRAYLAQVLRLILEPDLRRAVVLMGPRRVGKTMLIRHLIANLLERGINPRSMAYVEMDHPLLHGQSLESLVHQIETATPGCDETRYLFFDEIQSHNDWEKHLKPLVDHRPDLRLLVSGSAAAALKRQSTESGAGRFTDFLLPPLTFSEYLDLRKEEPAMHEIHPNSYALNDIHSLNSQFIDYVNYGGYPELALSPSKCLDPERFVESDIVEKVLLRDLPQLYGISNIQELNSLFALLAFNTAEEISIEQLSQRSGVGKSTIQKYIVYLEAAFLIKRVFRVDQDGHRYKRARNFKVYLTNSAMYTGLFGYRGTNEPDFGHLVETAIFSQRFEQVSHLNYARWSKKGYEVDLVESSPALVPARALEIKWSDRFVGNPQALKGLIRFTRNNHLKKAWASTRSQFDCTYIGDIEVRQWPTAVLAFHFGASAARGRLADFDAEITEAKRPALN